MLNKKLNFAFFGTPDVASETLQILKSASLLPSLIITSPDKPQGRKMLLTPPPVKKWAIENNIPFIQPEKINLEEIYNVLGTSAQTDESSKANFQQKIMRSEQNIIDFFLVVAYGKILSKEIINMPRLGSINIHYSLLPKYRGASPVESAILNGDTETGVSIQQMEYKMDSGPLIALEKANILPDEKASELRKLLIKIGGKLLVKILPDFVDGKIKSIPQNESDATFCKKIKKEDGLIDVNEDPIKNYNKFRAYSAWPRTFFFQDGKRIIITDALLENREFTLRKVLPEGKKEVTWKEFTSSNH